MRGWQCHPGLPIGGGPRLFLRAPILLNDASARPTLRDFDQSVRRLRQPLGVSPSALSHKIRKLETELGLRLLTRITRRVATTEAGERLLDTLRPAIDAIERQLAGLSDLRDRPSGSIRITASDHAAGRFYGRQLIFS